MSCTNEDRIKHLEKEVELLRSAMRTISDKAETIAKPSSHPALRETCLMEIKEISSRDFKPVFNELFIHGKGVVRRS